MKKKKTKKKLSKKQLEAKQAELDDQKVADIQNVHIEDIKERVFVNEYLKDFNGTQAAIKAGWKESSARQTAYRLLTKDYIQTAIKKRVDDRIAALQLDQNFVIKGLIEVYERCMQAEPVLDGEGEPTGEWKFDSKSANKALESLGRHLQMFPNNVKHSNDPENPLPAGNVVIYLPDNGRTNNN